MSGRIILPPWYHDRQHVVLSQGVRAYRSVENMLSLPPVLWSSFQSNLTASARTGTTVTANATPHSEGAWTSIIDPTSKPSYGIFFRLRGVPAGNTSTRMLVDIAYGPTGGGNEEVLIADINAGAAGHTTGTGHGKTYYFPVYIPSGVRVSMRAQALIASDTVSAAIWLCQDPPYELVAGGVLSYGVVSASSRGTSVTPGSGGFGSWTSLGTTSRNHRYWHVGYGFLDDTTVANADVMIELGVGPDASNVSTIHTAFFAQTSSEDCIGPFPCLPTYNPVVSGNEIWGRIASAETEARDLIAHGID